LRALHAGGRSRELAVLLRGGRSLRSVGSGHGTSGIDGIGGCRTITQAPLRPYAHLLQEYCGSTVTHKP